MNKGWGARAHVPSHGYMFQRTSRLWGDSSCTATRWSSTFSTIDATTATKGTAADDLPIHVIDAWGGQDSGHDLLLIPPLSNPRGINGATDSSPAPKQVNRGKEFVKALRAPRSLEELRDLAIACRPHMDSQAVTALASHLADRCTRLTDETAVGGSDSRGDEMRQVQSFMRSEWVPLFRVQVFRMDAAGLCICVQSAAKVAVAADVISSGAGAGPGGARALFDTYSSMRTTSSAVLDESDIEAVMQASDAILHTFSSRSAVQLLWGLVSQVGKGSVLAEW